MRYLSICSGIEAASVAWHGLGWTPVAFSEIEPFPSAVLKHHYPSVPNLGDMITLPERILSRELEAPDLLVGGPPCQAFSVAGLRRGLDDARGSLTLTYCEIANAIDHVRLADGRDPAIIVYENVPGLLSSKDNAFGCLLAGLAGESEALQAPRGKWRDAGVVVGPQRLAVWRVLDAQFFAVAQRRRRIFLISVALRHPRAWAIAESILPLSTCLSWNSPSREQASKISASGATPSVAGSLDTECGGGKLTHQSAANGHVIAQPSWWDGADVAATLTRQNAAGGQRMPDKDNLGAVLQPVAHALRGEGFDASEDGTGRGTPIVPVAGSHWDHPSNPHPTLNQSAKGSGGIAASDQELFSQRGSGLVPQPVAFHPTQDPISSVDGTTHAMGCGSKQGTATVAVAFKVRGGVEVDSAGKAAGKGYLGSEETAFTLAATQDQWLAAPPAMQVRRLTPTECERLQGFPDGWTNIPWRKKNEAPDGPRYKALGNSMAVPCMRWIGERIQAATARQEVKP